MYFLFFLALSLSIIVLQLIYFGIMYFWLSLLLRCGYATTCWSIHLLIVIWVVWLLQIKLWGAFLYKSLWGHKLFISRGYRPSRMIGLYVGYIYNFLRNCQIAFQSLKSGCKVYILYSPSQKYETYSCFIPSPILSMVSF